MVRLDQGQSVRLIPLWRLLVQFPLKVRFFAGNFSKTLILSYLQKLYLLGSSTINVEWMDGVARVDGVAKSIFFPFFASYLGFREQ